MVVLFNNNEFPFFSAQVSGSGPSFILYSGHDHTLEHLTTALGLPYDATLLRYGARLVIEVYRNATRETDKAAGDVFFRLLVNGKDVTNRIGFCRTSGLHHATEQAFCKMERMVRFVHDDYFATLNGSNFKEACGMKVWWWWSCIRLRICVFFCCWLGLTDCLI